MRCENNIIEIKNLYKSFKDVCAVDDLSFSVREGELFAFLGENGAGKSTTIKILSGVLDRSGGEVKICGENIDVGADKIKSQIGMVFQDSVLDKNLSVIDNLTSRAALYGVVGAKFDSALKELDELLSIKEILPRPLNKLSGGQRRRADIARALVHFPKLLILDEPTTGLDPNSRRAVWSAVEKLRRTRKMTVFLTTHYMEEAAAADYVVIIDKGKKVAEGTPHELKTAFAKDSLRLYSHLEEGQKLFYRLGFEVKRGGDFIEVGVQNSASATRIICAHPELFDDYEFIKGDMDGVFLSVTGRTAAKE